MPQFPQDFHEPCISTVAGPRPRSRQRFLKAIRTQTCWVADLWMQCASLIAACMSLWKDLGCHWGGGVVSACRCVSPRGLWICFSGAFSVCRLTSPPSRSVALSLWGRMDKYQICQSTAKPQAPLLRHVWLAGYYSSGSIFSLFFQLCFFFFL